MTRGNLVQTTRFWDAFFECTFCSHQFRKSRQTLRPLHYQTLLKVRQAGSSLEWKMACLSLFKTHLPFVHLPTQNDLTWHLQGLPGWSFIHPLTMKPIGPLAKTMSHSSTSSGNEPRLSSGIFGWQYTGSGELPKAVSSCYPIVKVHPLVILHSYWKWPFIVDLPIRHGDFP